MRVFITKYALTQGIFEIEANVLKPGMIRTVTASGGQVFFTPDWYTTRSDAVDRATNMLHGKIKSLKRQIEKLEKKDEDQNWPQIKSLGTPA